MFEEEAEEYAENREVCDLLDAISENLQNYDYGTVAHYNIDPLVEECFKDGAEFGYNKCKEEINQKGLALQSDMDETIKQNVALKKENEELRAENEANENGAKKYAEFYFQTNDKLTEAKTHIHRLLILLTEGKRSYAFIDEARAFMKEE